MSMNDVNLYDNLILIFLPYHYLPNPFVQKRRCPTLKHAHVTLKCRWAIVQTHVGHMLFERVKGQHIFQPTVVACVQAAIPRAKVHLFEGSLFDSCHV